MELFPMQQLPAYSLSNKVHNFHLAWYQKRIILVRVCYMTRGLRLCFRSLFYTTGESGDKLRAMLKKAGKKLHVDEL